MGVDRIGVATCIHCGARLKLFSIFNRSMQGLANVWRKRHQRGCAKRTPEQRHAWARRYVARGDESSITIDLAHPGMRADGANGSKS
jgi:hypothetical protein